MTSLPTIATLLLLLHQLSVVVNASELASHTVKSLFDSADGIRITGSILAVAAIAVGAAMVVLGYRLFRFTLFAVGFVVGGVAIATIIEHIFDDKSWVITASWVALVVGGLICGGLVMTLYSFGIFVVGAAGGVVLAMMLQNSFGYKIYPEKPEVVLIVLCVALGIIGGILALRLEKPVLIVATSLFGAGILVWGVGYFAGDFPSTADLKEYASRDINGDWVYSIPDAWWAYLVGILVLFVIGMVLQFRKTGRSDSYHRSHAIGRSDPVQYVEACSPQQQKYDNPARHV